MYLRKIYPLNLEENHKSKNCHISLQCKTVQERRFDYHNFLEARSCLVLQLYGSYTEANAAAFVEELSRVQDHRLLVECPSTLFLKEYSLSECVGSIR